jgi:anti-sigma B factor antagonist
MDQLFRIDDSRLGSNALVALSGEIDLAAGPAVRDHVIRLLDAGTAETAGITEIVIDLSGVTFLDSSGIGMLLTCRNLAIAAGKTFRAINARDRVAAVLAITGVGGILAGNG